MNKYETGILGDLCDVSIGRTPRRNEPRYWNGPHPWATVRDLSSRILNSTPQGITDTALHEVMPQPVDPGTLLFSFKLSIGKMAFAGRKMHHNEAIAALPVRDPSVLDREFLYYALKAITHNLDANHAVLGKVLNKSRVKAIKIPLPSLAEQRQITGVLNRASNVEHLLAQASKEASDLTDSLISRLLKNSS